MGDDNILVAADLLDDGGLELCKVGFSALGAEVSCNGSFKISNAFSNLVEGLIGLLHAVDSQFFDWFLVVRVCVVVGEEDFQVEISVESLDSFVDIILVMNFLGTGMNFRPTPSTVAAAAGIDFLVVRSWKCLFVKWVK
jgi:hypothetical protein